MTTSKLMAVLLAIVVKLTFSSPILTLAQSPSSTDTPVCNGESRGKHFIVGFSENIDGGVISEISVTIVASNKSQQLTDVTIRTKHELAPVRFEESFTLEAGGFRRITVPNELALTNDEKSFKGIEISATNDVYVHGLMRLADTTDGFLALPTLNLGRHYVVLVLFTTGSFTSTFAVIGTEDSTMVHVTLSGPVRFDGKSYSAGDVVRFVVDKLQAVQIGGSLVEDLTGSIITTDKPVAVFSGHECATTGYAGTACDILTEQMIPVKSWGKRHVYTAATSSDTNRYRIVAFFPGTVANIPGSPNITLEVGEFWEGELSGSGLVSSSEPVLMMQQLSSIEGTYVDPSLIQVPAEKQFAYLFGFTTPPRSTNEPSGFFNFITIILEKDARQTVHLNGSPLKVTTEHDVLGTNYTSITVELPKGEGVYYVEQTDRSSSPLSVIIYGYEDYESYGYAAGLSLPSNADRQLLTLTPFFLRELGGEMLTITIPCLMESANSVQNPNQKAKCIFSTDIGDVLVPGDRIDPYNIVCVTPTFYKNGLTYVSVSLDDGGTFPYFGPVYIASEEDFAPLVTLNQELLFDKSGILDLTSERNVVLTWVPDSVGQDVQRVTVMVQDSDFNDDGYPVLLDGVIVKFDTENDGEFMVSPSDLRSLLDITPITNLGGTRSKELSLVTFYLTRLDRFGSKLYSKLKAMKKYISDSPCNVFEGVLKEEPSGVSASPCTVEQAEADFLNFEKSNALIGFFHPGAVNCFRSVTSSESGSGQQACYGKDGNILVGPPSGGSADRYSPGTNFWKHQWFDVLPYFGCCKFSSNCDKYYKYRPSDDCSKYVPPRPAGGTGDPHLTSLDGKKFTFNGAGEFLMASSNFHNLIFQGRMEVYQNASASVYTAIVVQVNNSTKVQVQLSIKDGTLILIDDVPLRRSSTPIRVHHREGLRISFPIDLSQVRIVFSAGIVVVVYIRPEVMSFIAQLDAKFAGQVKGLLGNMNGDPDDDLQFPNGTIVKTDSSLAEVHEIGLEWRLAQDQSIFTYLPPFDYSTYNLSAFTPNLSVPDPVNVPQEIKDLCGTCAECLYDALTTGSLSFANETLAITGTIAKIQTASVKIVSCGFPDSVQNGTVHGTVFLEGSSLNVTCQKSFSLEGSASLICMKGGLWSSKLPRCVMNDGLSPLLITLIVFGGVGLLIFVLGCIMILRI